MKEPEELPLAVQLRLQTLPGREQNGRQFVRWVFSNESVERLERVGLCIQKDVTG